MIQSYPNFLLCKKTNQLCPFICVEEDQVDDYGDYLIDRAIAQCNMFTKYKICFNCSMFNAGSINHVD